MTLKNPPALAAWILEHLVFGGNEALAGDLLEEFRSGRSAAWYWRQVLIAMALGFFKDLRTHWLALCFAALWTLPVVAFQVYLVRRMAQSPFVAQRWRLAWPYSTICDLAFDIGCDLLYIWAGLALCFVLASLIARTLNLRRLTRSLWTSVLTYILAFAALLAVLAAFPLHGRPLDVRHVAAGQLLLITHWTGLAVRFPYFLALFMGIRGLLPRSEDKIVSVAC